MNTLPRELICLITSNIISIPQIKILSAVSKQWRDIFALKITTVSSCDGDFFCILSELYIMSGTPQYRNLRIRYYSYIGKNNQEYEITFLRDAMFSRQISINLQNAPYYAFEIKMSNFRNHTLFVKNNKIRYALVGSKHYHFFVVYCADEYIEIVDFVYNLLYGSNAIVKQNSAVKTAIKMFSGDKLDNLFDYFLAEEFIKFIIDY